MNLNLALALVALGIHAAALCLWLFLRAKVEHWIWWTVVVGFVLTWVHGLAGTLHYNPFPGFTHANAIAIALVALSSVLQTKRSVRKRELHDAALAKVHDKLERLRAEVENREPIATKVAEIIGDLRSQITFYEDQAKIHSLPLYPDQPRRAAS